MLFAVSANLPAPDIPPLKASLILDPQLLTESIIPLKENFIPFNDSANFKAPDVAEPKKLAILPAAITATIPIIKGFIIPNVSKNLTTYPTIPPTI